MRRHAWGFLASGAVLFTASAVGAVGTWALVTAVLVLTAGAVVLAIAMEDAAPMVPVAGARSGVGRPDPDLAA